MSDAILANPLTVKAEYRTCFAMGLYFVALQSGKLIYIDFSFENLLFMFWEQYMHNFEHEQWKNYLSELRKEPMLWEVGKISLVEYSKMKEWEKVTDNLL
jgi:hypothetical protein